MTALKQAKQLLPLPDLLAQLGLGEHAKKSARCPFHEDSSNSFSVFQKESGEWAWNCFAGCGGGDVADFLERLEGISNREACQRLIALSGSRLFGSAHQSTPIKNASLPIPNPLPALPAPVQVSDAWKEGLDYLFANPTIAAQLAAFRGWPVEFVQYLIDCAGISMPLYYNQRGLAFQVVAPQGERGSMTTLPIGYHIRLKHEHGAKCNSDCKKKCSWRFAPHKDKDGRGQSTPALPYLLGDFEKADLLIIAEGIWDPLSVALSAGWLGAGCLWPEGVGLVGIRGAKNTDSFLNYYSKFWPRSVSCLVLADSDTAAAGWYSGDNSFASKLASRSGRVAVVDCAPYKDFNALYSAEKPGPDAIADLLASRGMSIGSGVTA